MSTAAGHGRAIRGLLLLAAAFCCAGPGRAQASPPAPDAAALMARAAALYGDGAAHACAFTQIYTPAGFATSKRESGVVWVQAPQRLRFDYAAPDKKVFTYNAGEGRFFSPEDMQLTIRKLTADEQARLPLVFLSKPEELAGRYDIQLDAAKAVLLKPRAATAELAWLKLAIDAAGAVESLSYEDASGNRTEFRFDAWKSEKARPPEDYRIVGPKGTRIVEN